MNYDYSQPGDVIMGRTGDLNDPDFLCGTVGMGYYTFGVVRGLCYIKSDLKYNRRIDDGNKDCDECLEVVWIKVVAKCTDDNVKGMNKFTQDQVNEKIFAKNEG